MDDNKIHDKIDDLNRKLDQVIAIQHRIEKNLAAQTPQPAKASIPSSNSPVFKNRALIAALGLAMALIALVTLVAPDWQTVYPQIRQMLRWFKTTTTNSPAHSPVPTTPPVALSPNLAAVNATAVPPTL